MLVFGGNDHSGDAGENKGNTACGNEYNAYDASPSVSASVSVVHIHSPFDLIKKIIYPFEGQFNG